MNTVWAIAFVATCVLLVVVVLLQKGRGGGVGGLFGGAGSSAFGTRTGDVFTWVTIALVAFFLLLAVGVNLWFRPPRSQVSTPTFLPAPGLIDAPKPVTLRCNTAGADIHFTVDGTEPTQASLKFDNAPFRVDPGTTVKARAYLSGWDPSGTSTAVYGDIDEAPPLDTRPPASQPATAPASMPALAPIP